MIALLSWRVWVLVGLLALGPILYMKGRQDGQRSIKLEWTASVAAANLESFKRTERLQSNVDAAQKSAVTRAAVVRRDASRTSDAVLGLRNAINARRVAEESAAAASKRADTYGELFLEGVQAYRELAETCDRHVNDEKLLLEAWPK